LESSPLDVSSRRSGVQIELEGISSLPLESKRRPVHTYVKQTIIVLEDDPDIAQLVQHHLQLAGFAVRLCASGDQVLPLARKNMPSLFLLDIMVPGDSGFEVCRQIRASHEVARVPVIFLTARAAEADRVRGLDLGADDYITKPFGTRELAARVRAVLRRFEQPVTTTITMPDFELRADSMTLSVRGTPTEVTATEFRLLHFLASHPGRVFTRDQVLDAVWRDLAFVTSRSVDVYIRRLREKIERDPENPRYLKTVRGAGYKFEAAR
jgi:DNA-binding response OmpR family regulator